MTEIQPPTRITRCRIYKREDLFTTNVVPERKCWTLFPFSFPYLLFNDDLLWVQ